VSWRRVGPDSFVDKTKRLAAEWPSGGREIRRMAGFGRQRPESGVEVVEAGISPRQQRAIAALLSEPRIQDAAATAGVGERTLRRWLRQPNFSRAYLECRREAVGQATARLQQAAEAESELALS